jgi:hypothetical protein
MLWRTRWTNIDFDRREQTKQFDVNDPTPRLMTAMTSKILATRHVTFLRTNLKRKTFRTESGQTSVSLRHVFTRLMIRRRSPLDGGSDAPCTQGFKFPQKIKNWHLH